MPLSIDFLLFEYYLDSNAYGVLIGATPLVSQSVVRRQSSHCSQVSSGM